MLNGTSTTGGSTGLTTAPDAPTVDYGANVPTITVGGWNPQQYQNFITNDPGYMAMKAALQGNEDAFRGAMRGAIQKAYLSSGYNIPELSSYLDAGMADQAASNPYSEAALSAQSHQNNMRAIQNALAARGGYDSGELTYGVGNEAQRYNVEGLQNRGKLADYVGQLQGQMAQMSSQDAAQLASELGNATQRQLALHPASQSTTANWDALSQSYVDQQGNHYDINGNVLGAAGGQPAPYTPPTYTPTPYTPSTPSFTYTPESLGIQSLFQTPSAPTTFSSSPSYTPPSLVHGLLGIPN